MCAPRSWLRGLLAATVLLQPLASTTASADPVFGRLGRLFKEAAYHGEEPKTCEVTAIEDLAKNIDWLEHHIDRYGSIVAKQPDIWGEARLTKHRDEYERVLFQELSGFKVLLNASITQSDSSFLTQALALSAAASGSPPAVGTLQSGARSSADGKTVTAILADASLSEDDQEAINARFGITTDDEKISLEPVLQLDQLSRYVQHLHELRRVNEGDDTSDSPGYSLNLVRMPISILPGKLTREGFGAEVTVTATPVISDDLLPTTFRNLVVNDVVDLAGLPLVRMTEFLPTREGGLYSELSEAFAASNRTRQALRIAYERHAGSADASTQIADDIFDSVQEFLEDDVATGAFLASLNRIRYAVEQRKLTTPAAVIESLPSGLSPPTVLPASPPSLQPTPAGPEVGPMEHGGPIDANKGARAHRGDDVVLTVATLEPLRPATRRQAELNDDFREGFSSLKEFVLPPDEVAPVAAGPDESADSRPYEDAFRNRIDQEIQRLGDDLDYFDEDVLDRFLDDVRQRRTYNVALQLAEYMEDYPELLEKIGQIAFVALAERVLDAAKSAVVSPTGRARRAVNPLNPSSVVDVMGIDNFRVISSNFFRQSYSGRYIRWNGGPEPTCAPGGEFCVPEVDGPCIAGETRVDLLDARRFLEAELGAAYEMLSNERFVCLYAALAAPESGLSHSIRTQHVAGSDELGCPTTAQFRNYFFNQLQALRCQAAGYDGDCDFGNCLAATGGPLSAEAIRKSPIVPAQNTVEALAWMVVVESALLNDRLNEDVQKLAVAKEAPDLNVGRDLMFFLPGSVAKPDGVTPGLLAEFEQATRVFKRYVEVRWPIHVFAVDPREQDQNVADISTRKREMQFALALGFVTGQIGASSMTQYSRDLETQIETISLNRTVIGFGHGDDTFGWRFQPRVQALEVPGLLGSIRETICGASRDYDLRQRNLEPGVRECTALVLMPSFVPYADFDVRTNWYKLTNPKNAALTMKDTMHLSRAITTMRNSRAQCSSCAHLYREGEVQRLMRRVQQLDHELPLQTYRTQVPYENTLGGFEMFNTGVTDLSPELLGYYGAPGVVVFNNCESAFQCGCTAACTNGGRTPLTCTGADANTAPLPICEGSGTTLFLVGSNFSVHDTKVIAGGVCIPTIQLVSREILRVTIPSCVNTTCLCENGQMNEYVSVYVATPYGVTNHLHVPTHRRRKLEDATAADNCKCTAAPAVTGALWGVTPPLPKPLPPTERGATGIRLVSSQSDLVGSDAAWNSAPTHRFLLVAEGGEEDPPTEDEFDRKLRLLEDSLTTKIESLRDTRDFTLEVATPDVNVVIPEEKRREWCDGRDHPLLHQMKVRTQECWRNVRDQLPGY